MTELAFRQVDHEAVCCEAVAQLSEVSPVFVLGPAGYQDVIQIDRHKIQSLAD